MRKARRAQGPSRLAVAITLTLAPVFPGHALTCLSTARGSSSAGRIGLDTLERASLVKHRPGDTGQLVGERNRQHVVLQALLGRFDPRLELVALPSVWLDLGQHNRGGLNEQRAQIAIATPRYRAEDYWSADLSALFRCISHANRSPQRRPYARPLLDRLA